MVRGALPVLIASGVMKRTLWLVGVVAGLAAACGGDDGGGGDRDGAVIDAWDGDGPPPIDAPAGDGPAIDGPVDAMVDAAGCGTDLRLVGDFLDWDSTNAAFMGVSDSTWTVVGDLARTTTTGPNGVVLLCLAPGVRSQIDIATPGYVPARFIADPPVFSPAGSRFAARGLASAMATAQFAELGLTYNQAFAHVLVYKIGAPIPLALAEPLNPPQRSFVSDGANDITWTEGNSGTFTLFPNRPFSAAGVTLTSTTPFVGPTDLPLASGRFTIVVIR